jgi:hypothetical protein
VRIFRHIGATIGQRARDALEHTAGHDRTLNAEIGRQGKLANEVDQPSSKIESDFSPFTSAMLLTARSIIRANCIATRSAAFGVRSAERIGASAASKPPSCSSGASVTRTFTGRAQGKSFSIAVKLPRLSTFRILRPTPKRSANIASPFGRTHHHRRFTSRAPSVFRLTKISLLPSRSKVQVVVLAILQKQIPSPLLRIRWARTRGNSSVTNLPRTTQ